MLLSCSSFLAFEECPRRYGLGREEHAAGRPWELSFGTELHRAARAFFTDSVAPADWRAAEERHFAQWLSAAPFPDEVTRQAYARLATYVLDRFIATQTARRGHQLALERSFTASLGELVLRGRLDRLDQDPDGLTILDYKFEARPPALVAGRQLDQLGYYQLLVGGDLGRVVRLAIYDFISGRLVSTPALAPAARAQLAGRIRRAGRSIAAGKFPPQPGHACATCPFLGRCAEGRAHVAAAA